MFIIDLAAKIAEPLKKQFKEAAKAYQDFVDSYILNSRRLNQQQQQNANNAPGGSGGSGGSGQGSGGSGAPGSFNPTNANGTSNRNNSSNRGSTSTLISLMRQDRGFKDAISAIYAYGSNFQRRNLRRAYGSDALARRYYSDYRAGRLNIPTGPAGGGNGGAGGGNNPPGNPPPPANPPNNPNNPNSPSFIQRLTNLWKKFNETRNKGHKDFSVMQRIESGYIGRLYRQVIGLITAYASFRTAIQLGNNLLEHAKEVELSAFQGQVPFGNKANYLKARQFAKNLSLSGKSPFAMSDMTEGFKSLMEAGLNPVKNFNTIGDIAGKTGKQFNEVANDIVSAIYGDSTVLRKYGVTNRDIFRLERLVDQRPDTRKNVIMQMLMGRSEFKGGMKEFAASWGGLMAQLKSHWENFADAIMGSPDDKNSLYSKVKGVFEMIIGWLQKNEKRLRRLGMAIGEIGKWVVRQIVEIGKWVAKQLGGVLDQLDGTTEKYQTTIMKLVLWLELTKVRVVRFFKEWGWAIKDFVILWGALKVLSIFTGLGSTVINMFSAVAGALGVSTGMLLRLGGIAGVLMWGLTPKGDRGFSELEKFLNTYLGIGFKDKNGNWISVQEQSQQAGEKVSNDLRIIQQGKDSKRLQREQAVIDAQRSNPAITKLMDSFTGGAYSKSIANDNPKLPLSPLASTQRATAGRIDKQINFTSPININVFTSDPSEAARRIKALLEEDASMGGFPAGMKDIDPKSFMRPQK